MVIIRVSQSTIFFRRLFQARISSDYLYIILKLPKHRYLNNYLIINLSVWDACRSWKEIRLIRSLSTKISYEFMLGTFWIFSDFWAIELTLYPTLLADSEIVFLLPRPVCRSIETSAILCGQIVPKHSQNRRILSPINLLMTYFIKLSGC